jgi:hypothetical protein
MMLFSPRCLGHPWKSVVVLKDTQAALARPHSSMRVGVLPIGHASRPVGVVAFGNLPNPVRRLARADRKFAHRLPFAQEPQDLVSAALVRFFGSPVAVLELVHREMCFQTYVSRHAAILQGPRRNWYYKRFRLAQLAPFVWGCLTR